MLKKKKKSLPKFLPIILLPSLKKINSYYQLSRNRSRRLFHLMHFSVFTTPKLYTFLICTYSLILPQPGTACKKTLLNATSVEFSHQQKCLYHHSLLLVMTAGPQSISNVGLTLFFVFFCLFVFLNTRSKIPYCVVVIFICLVQNNRSSCCVAVGSKSDSRGLGHCRGVGLISGLGQWIKGFDVATAAAGPRFNPWPGNFHMLQVWPGGEKKEFKTNIYLLYTASQ